jgi:hypothetical protein
MFIDPTSGPPPYRPLPFPTAPPAVGGGQGWSEVRASRSMAVERACRFSRPAARSGRRRARCASVFVRYFARRYAWKWIGSAATVLK